jgi:hypothetical protein
LPIKQPVDKKLPEHAGEVIYTMQQHEPSDTPQVVVPVPRRNGSFLSTMKAVFWSFFGVRKGRHSAQDEASLNPVHVVFAALLAAFIFIVVLIVIVKIVLAKIVI